MKSIVLLLILVGVGAGAGPAGPGGGPFPAAAPAAAAEPDPSAAVRGEPNRLAGETSPYLRRQADSPVDWYPWGPEALERARAENKPIFLSIGYATCHWCNVMGRETFRNPRVAALLNEHFVPILVDRDERPDLDRLFLAAAHHMIGRGAWPLTVVMTPDLGPFFAGTYHAPDQSRGRRGLVSILENLNLSWRDRRDEVLDYGARVRAHLRDRVPVREEGAEAPDAELLDDAYDLLLYAYDKEAGGFRGTPKFPLPHKLSFLLRHAHRTGSEEALAMVRRTLDVMAAGGLHDHLGGGFHRYAQDGEWIVPHFAKRLDDQAGLALLYLDAWRATGDPVYRAVTEGTLDYVLRDLALPGGAFASAEDADSDRGEGEFYLWSATEIDSVLGAAGPGFRDAYRVTVGGDLEGRNVLRVGRLDPEVLERFADERRRLAEARSLRPRPYRDEKAVTAVNGFAIEALARAGAALGEPRYLDAARAAARFLIDRHWSGEDLRRYSVDGIAAQTPGYLDDYAYLGRGLLALYEATGEPEWLRAARRAAGEIPRLFAREEGGYSFTRADADTVIAPVVDIFDTEMPSGNGVAAVLFARLGHLTGDAALEERGRAVVEDFAAQLEAGPADHVEMLYALEFGLGPKTEVVIAGDPADPATRALVRAVHERYLPLTVLAQRPVSGAEDIISLIPYLEAQTVLDGRPTGYVCRNYACRFPVHEVEALVRELEAD